jgi:photosystem II stability/assembly factor-like uncharacterized protein
MMDPQETDQLLRDLYERNSEPVDMVTFSAELHERLSTLPAHKGWMSRLRWPLAAPAEEWSGRLKRASAPKRRSGVTVAVFASIAVVLVAAVAVGSFMAVRNLAQPGFVLAITDDNLVGTAAQSSHWEQLPLTSEGGPVNALVMDPSNPSILYAGTSVGLFKSTDAAGSWTQLSTVPGSVFVVAIDPASPSTVYVQSVVSQREQEAGTFKLLRSDDGGATWTDLSGTGTPASPGYDRGIWFDTTSTPSTIYIWGRVEPYGFPIWRSTDRGETWTGRGVGDKDVLTPASPTPISPAAQQALDAFWASYDPYSSGPTTDADTSAVVEIGQILVDPTRVSTFYASTGDGVYKSIDSGRSWRKSSKGMVERGTSGVLVDSSAPSTLYAAASAGIFRSIDGGAEWTLVLGGKGSVVLAPSTPSRLYAWTLAGLFRSDDRGDSWTRLKAAGLPLPSMLGSPPPTFSLGQLVLVVADQPDTLFAVSQDSRFDTALYRSTDGGNTWGRAIEGDVYGWFGQVVADPQAPSTIYAFAYQGDPDHSAEALLKSTDAGATWESLLEKDWGLHARLAAVDPHNPEIAWTIQNSMIRRSTDAGATWENIGETLPNAVSLVPDPAPGGAFYAATVGGLFKWVPGE